MRRASETAVGGSNSMAPTHIFVHHLQPRKIMHGMAGNTAWWGKALRCSSTNGAGWSRRTWEGKQHRSHSPWESNNTNFLKLSDWFTFVISSMNIGSFIHAKDWFCFMYKNSTKTFLKFSTYWCHKCIVSFFVTWWILWSRFMDEWQ